MSQYDDVRAALAPTGVLRVTINVGNPTLANLPAGATRPKGVSVDIATMLAERLGLELELVVFDAAGKAVTAVTANEADMGFFAQDPTRGEGIAFTAPYMLIEGGYLVRDDSPIQTLDEVDRPEHRIAVGKGSAYDLFLSRTIERATLQRSPTSPTVVAYFMEHELEVAAGVKQQLEAGLEEFPGLRMLPGHFMTIKQAMGVPQDRPAAARAFLDDFIVELKQAGTLETLFDAHGIEGVTIAPLREDEP
ncbi:ABC transporter substrate-binding protein [Vreelandella malpeensis]|uniref:ABC transporter substrate-binding protein n=1 Tax=Vreelandella malpeensis TaxID=1172368 RepID=A0ABS8DMX4_9GAMM|nr:ABC transporter substrate-binding protein [Halomonas malpeensis]MCB8887652.1 ABC transporter substrate-binding protein [Halomonas malpeensis]